MVNVPDINKTKISDKLKDIKNYFKKEAQNEENTGNESVNVVKKDNVKPIVNISKLKKRYKSKNARKMESNNVEKIESTNDKKLVSTCYDEKKDNLKTNQVSIDKVIVNVNGYSNKKASGGKENDGIIPENQPSNVKCNDNDSQNCGNLVPKSKPYKKLNFSNLKGYMPSPKMDVISDKWSSSVKYVRKGFQNIDMRKPDLGSLKKRLSTLTKESRREKLEKIEEEEKSTKINNLLPDFNKFVKSNFNKMNLRIGDNKRIDGIKKEEYTKEIKSNMDKRTPFSYLAKLSVDDVKGLVPDNVYKKLYMNNKFSSGYFTDENGRPYWSKKSTYKSTDSSEDSETDSGDICAAVTDSLIAYCEGKFEISDPLPRICTNNSDGELQEFTKNDKLYTMENVINNTVRSFSKMENYKKSIKSWDSIEQSRPKVFQMPPLKFAKEVKVIVYNRVNPCELVEPIQYVPYDIGPTKFIDSKIK